MQHISVAADAVVMNFEQLDLAFRVGHERAAQRETVLRRSTQCARQRRYNSVPMLRFHHQLISRISCLAFQTARDLLLALQVRLQRLRNACLNQSRLANAHSFAALLHGFSL